ncbi:MAG: succinylglutamate desuccinylase/aspartoacylase family protein [Candidatus Adiutrix sp.]|jgi:hypothetical protein|nr:succinylglutamate desuccinylase/aspartoacylase family protein [Candidatus Adiutrix sp.]
MRRRPVAGVTALSLFLALAAAPLMAQESRQHLVYWAGTPQAVEVYKIFGREPGPTVMIMGGIQGDEPGGFLCADLYTGVSLKRGNLIVLPRANFKSIAQFNRGTEGDMNRKFQGDLGRDDPYRDIVALIKSLMAESDLFLNLHDGSGYYRPTYESDLANPNRYGQSIIADADSYTHGPTGRVIPLASYAEEVIARVNREIAEPLQHFHFFNTRTGAADSPYKEQRQSASYYALTQLGIPAYGVEASKQLPNLELKVYHHNLAVTAFLDLFGVEMDRPSLNLPSPRLGYVVITAGDHPPVVALDGQTLMVAPGETVTVVEVAANYDRGLSAAVEGLGGWNDLGRPFTLERSASITVRKDQTVIGRVRLELLPEAGPPRLSSPVAWRSVRSGEPAVLASATPEPPPARPAAAGEEAASVSGSLAAPGRVTGFLVDVDGRTMEVAPGGTLVVPVGAIVTMVDFTMEGGGPPPGPGVVMNLRGFVPKEKMTANDGEDRGFPADTARDMMPSFSQGGRGRDYAINIERGKTVLASATLSIIKPRLESVTIEVDGKTLILSLGSRTILPEGTAFTVTEIKLAEDLTFSRPVFTLGGLPLAPELPLNLSVPSYAANLAVFNGETLAGKVTLAPR